MSKFTYEQSAVIATKGYQFESLIMAAMRKADSYNTAKLTVAFPAIWDELRARYNAPGGRLEGES